MDPFEYVVVLTSLILGLGIAQLLTGIADVISTFRNVKLYLPHTLFVVVIFLLHIQEWWINYQYASEVPVWTLKTVLSLLTYPIMLFIMARMIFPTGLRSHETDFKVYYHDQWRNLFFIGLLTVIQSILQNIFISHIAIAVQLPQLAYMSVYLVFIVFKIENHIAHLIFQLFSFFVLLGYIITDQSFLTMYN
jgi:hypothetical protein